MSQQSQNHKVVLIGIDGLDWDYLQLFADHGHLPTFSKLFEQAAAGRVTPPVQTSSALVWQTVLTGVTEEWHGVLDNMDYGPGGLSAQTVSSAQVRVPRIWDYASAQGLNSHVLGWPATLPVSLERGIMVANGVQYLDAGVSDVWPLHPHSVHPRSWREKVLDHRILADDIPQHYVEELTQYVSADLAESLRVPSTLLLGQMLSVHSLGIQLAEEPDWQFLAIRFDTLPLMYGLPYQIDFNETPLNYFIGWYKLLDAFLAKYLGYITDQDYILLCSDRGAPQAFMGKKQGLFAQQDPGIMLIKGPAIQPDSVIADVSLIDVCPTLLTMLGYQPHSKLLGKSLFQPHQPTQALLPISNWPEQPMQLDDIAPPQYASSDLAREFETAKLDLPDLSPLKNIALGVQVQKLFALSYAYRLAGQLKLSKQALQQLIQLDPNHLPGLIQLARTLIELNEMDACEVLVKQYHHLKVGPMWANLIDGMLALGTKNYLRARECFEILLGIENVPVNVHLWYAEVLIGMQRWHEAQQQLEQAIHHGNETLPSLQKLSLVELQLGSHESALEAINQAIALSPMQADLLIQRFLIKTRMGNNESARRDLNRALKIKPDILTEQALNAFLQRSIGVEYAEIYTLTAPISLD